MNYWFVKSPFRTRSWQDVLVKGVFKLYGIRNHQAKNNISKMKPDDKALFYHGPSVRQIYGIMQASKKPYPDPTTDSSDWLAIDFEPVKTFDVSVTLAQIRSLQDLKNMALLKQPRVMVTPLTKEEFAMITEIALVEGKG